MHVPDDPKLVFRLAADVHGLRLEAIQLVVDDVHLCLLLLGAPRAHFHSILAVDQVAPLVHVTSTPSHLADGPHPRLHFVLNFRIEITKRSFLATIWVCVHAEAERLLATVLQRVAGRARRLESIALRGTGQTNEPLLVGFLLVAVINNADRTQRHPAPAPSVAIHGTSLGEPSLLKRIPAQVDPWLTPRENPADAILDCHRVHPYTSCRGVNAFTHDPRHCLRAGGLRGSIHAFPNSLRQGCRACGACNRADGAADLVGALPDPRLTHFLRHLEGRLQLADVRFTLVQVTVEVIHSASHFLEAASLLLQFLFRGVRGLVCIVEMLQRSMQSHIVNLIHRWVPAALVGHAASARRGRARPERRLFLCRAKEPDA
mmetsp:Transcript_40349/g.111146  ORF Transcript_40349/g.111146 Transcript_40349/m.111146 type:complete len:374 (+) Transcript_40349:123-1244(+)